jgi:hypothetical protein
MIDKASSTATTFWTLPFDTTKLHNKEEEPHG